MKNNAQLQQMISSITALGRVGQPEDIGPVVASLFEDGNRWINGQRIEASGGMKPVSRPERPPGSTTARALAPRSVTMTSAAAAWAHFAVAK